MFFSVASLLASTLAATPASAAYVGVNSNARADLTQMYDRSIARSLADAGLLVSVGPSPVMTACHDDPKACSAQSAAAIQVSGWIRGALERDLTSMKVTLEFRAADGTVLFERSVSGTSDSAVLDQVHDQAPQWSRDYASALHLEVGEGVHSSIWPGVLMAGGGAAIAGATYLLLEAKSDYDRIDPTNRGLRPDQAAQLADNGRRDQRIGVPLAILGVAGVITGYLWYRADHSAAPRPVVTPLVTGSSAGVAITGALP